MRLIVITTETFFDGEADAVNLLFENRLDTLHLRKPHASLQETKDFLFRIKSCFRARIVIHDHYQLMNIFSIKGIHLNRRSKDNLKHAPNTNDSKIIMSKVNSPRYGRGQEGGCSLSRSCHSLEEITASSYCDYVFLSPIFDSISKAGYIQAFTHQHLHEAKSASIINENVIALGGVTTENIPIARAFGFGGVAVLGALWDSFADNRNVSELLKRFNELKIKCDVN